MRAVLTGMLVILVFVAIVGGGGDLTAVEREKTARVREETAQVNLVQQWMTERVRLAEEGATMRAKFDAEVRIATEEGRTQRHAVLMRMLPVILVLVFGGMVVFALTVLRPDAIVALLPVMPWSGQGRRLRMLGTAPDPGVRVADPVALLEAYAIGCGLQVVVGSKGVYLLVDERGEIVEQRRLLEG